MEEKKTKEDLEFYKNYKLDLIDFGFKFLPTVFGLLINLKVFTLLIEYIQTNINEPILIFISIMFTIYYMLRVTLYLLRDIDFDVKYKYIGEK